MVSNLYLKDTYSSNNCLISNFIREYDISKANINILLSKKLISKEQYDYFYNLDKYQRNVQIGYLQKGNEIIKNGLNQGFKEYRQKFFEANNIQDEDVLLIKKDAIFVINKVLTNLEFDYVKFSEKNIYTSYYKVKNVEYFYFIDMVNNIENLTIKGLGMDESINLHNDYMIDFLKYLFELAQSSYITDVISILTTFINKYMNYELEINYYRELGRNKYKIKSTQYLSYYAEHLPEKEKYNLDIYYNLEILNILLGYYTEIYFSGRNRK